MQLTNSDLASMQQMILTTDVNGIFGKHAPHNRLFVKQTVHSGNNVTWKLQYC